MTSSTHKFANLQVKLEKINSVVKGVHAELMSRSGEVSQSQKQLLAVAETLLQEASHALTLLSARAQLEQVLQDMTGASQQWVPMPVTNNAGPLLAQNKPTSSKEVEDIEKVRALLTKLPLLNVQGIKLSGEECVAMIHQLLVYHNSGAPVLVKLKKEKVEELKSRAFPGVLSTHVHTSEFKKLIESVIESNIQDVATESGFNFRDLTSDHVLLF